MYYNYTPNFIKKLVKVYKLTEVLFSKEVINHRQSVLGF